MEYPKEKYEAKEENIKICVTCIGQDLNLVPPCKQTQTLPLCYLIMSNIIDFIRIIVSLMHIFYGKKATHAHLACMITFRKRMIKKNAR